MPTVLSTITVSVETGLALKDAGFPQGTVCQWFRDSERGRDRVGGARIFNEAHLCAAPTLAEILSELPHEVGEGHWLCDLVCYKRPDGAVVLGYDEETRGAGAYNTKHHDENPAEAAAALYLALAGADLLTSDPA